MGRIEIRWGRVIALTVFLLAGKVGLDWTWTETFYALLIVGFLAFLVYTALDALRALFRATMPLGEVHYHFEFPEPPEPSQGIELHPDVTRPREARMPYDDEKVVVLSEIRRQKGK